MRFLFTAILYTFFIQITSGVAPIQEPEINQKIKEIPESEPELKEKWEKLLEIRKTRNELSENSTTLTKAVKSLTTQQEKLAEPTDFNKVSETIPSPTQAQITDRVAEIKRIKEAIENKQETLDSSLVALESRQKIIPTDISKVQSDLILLNSSTEPTKEIDLFIKLELIAKHEVQLKKLNLEQEHLDNKIPQVKINLQTVSKDLERITELYTEWNDKLIAVNKITATSIKQKTKQLADKLSETSPAKKIATQTIELSDSLLTGQSIQTELKEVRKEISELKITQQLIDEQQKYAKERIELLERAELPIDRETGTLLRKQRSELPTEKDLKLRLASVFQSSTRNELALLKEREQREDYAQLSSESYAEGLTEKQRQELTQEEYSELISSTKKLHLIVIEERTALSKEYRDLITLLQETHKSSKNYSAYIDTRLLWIVSHPPINKSSFSREADGIRSLYSPKRLSKILGHWSNDLFQSPIIWVIFFLIIIALVLLRKKLHQWAKKAHKEASRGNCSSFKPTLKGLVCAVALVLPIPLIFAFLCWRTPSAFPLHAGLHVGALIYGILGLLYRLTRPEGFLEANGMATTGHLRLVRKVIYPLYIFLPPILITANALTQVNAELTPGRLLNMLVLIFMAASMHFILLPKKRLLSGKKKPGFISYLTYIAFVIFPLALVAVAASGYFISMLTLKTQLIYSIRVILLIFFVTALLKRWLLVTRRNALMSAHKSTLSDSESALTEQEKKQEIQDSVSKVSEQSTKLIKVFATVVMIFSLLTIWSKTLPALSVLDEVNLWETSTSESTSGSSSNTSIIPFGTKSSTSDVVAEVTEPEITYITLQDLLITIIVSFLTYLAAVNIPSLLQITIFNHLKLKHGTAFTITTAIRYIIIIVGIIWAFGSIGVTWDKIQWLAAAITLGIGFGLQEIFANFVAGLILLFERPIRIGDLITVGEINGKVSKIQMRATTILQFNNRELIVPNKEFITGQLVNWTLSDNVIRAEVAVGIAYGSDTELAKSLLLECAEQNKRTLTTPQPNVIFSSFGGSSLDFILRVHISSVDDLVPVQSELHFAIDNAFREADIEISFPQQDIHIRSIDAAFPTKSATDQESTAD